MFATIHHQELACVTGGGDVDPGKVATAAGFGGFASGLVGYVRGANRGRPITVPVQTSMGTEMVNAVDASKAFRGFRRWGLAGALVTGAATYAYQRLR